MLSKNRFNLNEVSMLLVDKKKVSMLLLCLTSLLPKKILIPLQGSFLLVCTQMQVFLNAFPSNCKV